MAPILSYTDCKFSTFICSVNVKCSTWLEYLPQRIKIYFHPLGCVLNSLQALCLSLAQYSRAMLGCYLKISQRTPSLWSQARAHWSSLQTPLRPHSSFSFQQRMKGWWREEKGREAFSLAFFGIIFSSSSSVFFYPAGHLFPVCNMTPVPNWVLLLLRCMCAIVGFMISCFPNAASHLCWYKVAHMLSCDSSVL